MTYSWHDYSNVRNNYAIDLFYREMPGAMAAHRGGLVFFANEHDNDYQYRNEINKRLNPSMPLWGRKEKP
jgi:hypothetical protein